MSELQRNDKRAEDPGDEQGGERQKEDETTSEVLTNPHVLEIVFKHLDTTRLKLFRTVCKDWNEEICRELRKRGFVSYVQAQGECSALMEVVSRNKGLELPKTFQNMVLQIRDKKMLSEILSVPLELPITKLEIHEEMDCRSAGSTGWMYALLRNCSSSLMSLKISLCSIEIPESARSSWEFKFPFLEELVLTADSRNLRDDNNPHDPDTTLGTKRSAGAVSFFSKLIASAPKLWSLEILQLSGSIRIFLESLGLENLREFKIWSNVPEYQAPTSRVLSRIKFKNLLSLSLNSSSGVFDNSDVEELLQRNSKSLESLSLGLFSFELPNCPNLKRLAVRNFEDKCNRDIHRLPALPSIEILEVDPSFLFSFQTCPVSLKKVKIDWGHKPIDLVREALLNLYRVFAQSAPAWGLRYEYVEGFCAFIAAEKGGKGITSLTIELDPKVVFITDLQKALGNISKLHDLEELTLRNTHMELPPQTWDLFNPQLLPNLHTLTYFSHSDDSEGLAELPEELLQKFKLIRTVVLLRNEPARYDRKTEEFFSRLPNAISRHEEWVRGIWVRSGVFESTNTFKF